MLKNKTRIVNAFDLDICNGNRLNIRGKLVFVTGIYKRTKTYVKTHANAYKRMQKRHKIDTKVLRYGFYLGIL